MKRFFVYTVTILFIFTTYAQNELPDFTIKNTSGCGGANTGTIFIETLSNDNIPLEYSKDNGQNWQNKNVFTNLPAGTYHILIRNPQTGKILPEPVPIEVYELKANAGPDIIQCESLFLMQATEPINDELGVWSLVTPTRGVTIYNPVLFNTMVRMDPEITTTVTLRWTVKNDYCRVYDDVVIKYEPCSIPVNPHLMGRFTQE